MKHYPRYGQKGFYMEYWNLYNTPRTAEETRRQLITLYELRTNNPNYHAFTLPPLSKRQKRLLKQYRAFCALVHFHSWATASRFFTNPSRKREFEAYGARVAT